MNEQIYLDQKEATILVGVFLALLVLVFVAGWLSGVLVGLPGVEKPLATVTPAVDIPPREAVVPVVAVKVPPPPPPAPAAYSVQVGAFATEARARQHVSELQARGYAPYVFQGGSAAGKTWFTTRLGDYADLETAREAAAGFSRDNGTTALVTVKESLEPVWQAAGSPPAVAMDADSDTDAAADTQSGGTGETEAPETMESETPGVGESQPPGPGNAAVAPGQTDESTLPGDPLKEAPDGGSGPDADAPSEVDAAAGPEAGRVSYAVQVGNFRLEENAGTLAADLQQKGYDALVWKMYDPDGGIWYAVRLGYSKTLAAARERAAAFRQRQGGEVMVIETRGPETDPVPASMPEATAAAVPALAATAEGPVQASQVVAEHYPYTIRLASYPSLAPARAAMQQYRRQGLAAFLVATDPNAEDVYWLVNAGAYADYAAAVAARQAAGVADSFVKKTPWANQVGAPMTLTEMAPAAARLAAADHIPYAVAATGGGYRLLVGAFATTEGASACQRRMATDGFASEVVPR